MCGIAGILTLGGPPPSIEQLLHMGGALAHRGPDELGVYRDDQVGLAHSRLAIVDLATGQQPLANEDDSLYVIFNGEIFNFIELRSELEALGHVFRTRSDTEVIVHAYEQWGNAAFARFNGQFAIALWNAREKRLALVRDRLGVRPLYFLERGGRVYFASEVKAVFAADAAIERSFDPVGLEETFTFWSSVAPQSVFQGVVELPPGRVRTYTHEGVHEADFLGLARPYGDGAGEQFSGDLGDAVRAVRSALERAVELRISRADVPVGSYLSGGLDSSLVAALARRVKGERLRTFSLRFEDPEYDETPYQQTMSALLGSEHAEVVVSRDDIARIFPEVIAHTERPILRTAPAPMFMLSNLVHREGIKVVLTGEGADEMFAGYDLFREAKVRRFWAKAPESSWRPLLLARLYPYLQRSPVGTQAIARGFFGRGLAHSDTPGFAHEPRWSTTSQLKRLFSADQRRRAAKVDVAERFLSSLPADFASCSALARDQYIEVRTLLSGYILSSQGDRMLMANSVEGRFPFLDKDVMALAHSLPDSFKLRVLDEKHVLKRVAAGVVPDAIIARKKQPYRAPDALAFIGPKRPDWISEVLSERAVRNAGVFEPASVAQLWKKCSSRSNDGQFSNFDNMALVGVLSTQLLHHTLISNNSYAGRGKRPTTTIDKLAR